jgi:hypothetical protein
MRLGAFLFFLTAFADLSMWEGFAATLTAVLLCGAGARLLAEVHVVHLGS